MKKSIFTALAMVAMVFTASAQEGGSFKAGIFAGIPVGDSSDISSFGIGLDIAQHWEVSEATDLGFASGFINAFGKTVDISAGGFDVTIDVPDSQFIPLAGSVRFEPSGDLRLGADVGYALGVNNGNKGGLYLRPTFGAKVAENAELNLSYIRVSRDGGSFAMVALGFLYHF